MHVTSLPHRLVERMKRAGVKCKPGIYFLGDMEKIQLNYFIGYGHI
jgi:hypothetical protein